ncbi:MAG: hypothetical protein E4G92_06765 [Bacteroidia bacterium]|nr:MAG: hypothetical protein E4G92_06765 [Bacteroidia bacterium]
MMTLSLYSHYCCLISFQRCFRAALISLLLHWLLKTLYRPSGWGGLSACIFDGRVKTLIFSRETLKYDVNSE